MRGPLFLTALEIASTIKDGATIAIAGSGGGLNEPDAVIEAIEQRFLSTGHPNNLTIVHALGIGARGKRGISRLAHEGMVKRVIGGHWTWSPQMQALAREEKIEAFTLPAGAIMHLMREIGAGRPGLFTHVGLETFADPRNGGGACNQKARAAEPVVELMEIDGKEVLRYKPFLVDIGIVRGTYIDSGGSLSCIEEAADIDVTGVALAAHNSGGLVLAQAREVVEKRVLTARSVTVPGIMIDHCLLAPGAPQTHAMPGYDLALAGIPSSSGSTAPAEPLPKGLRMIIASRAAAEIEKGLSVNFGFGIPGGIPPILAKKGMLDDVWISVEQGMHNGQLLDGDLFGAARYPDAMINSLRQFDFYSGGGIDLACLGMGELDRHGNVNVSRLGVDVVGPGGFVDITQNAKKTVFCGTFEAKGAKIIINEDGLDIAEHGKIQKLVGAVREISFSAEFAKARERQVIYVTERAVFQLVSDGIELIEMARGVDLERDIIARMEFEPLISRDLKEMDPVHFAGAAEVQ